MVSTVDEAAIGEHDTVVLTTAVTYVNIAPDIQRIHRVAGTNTHSTNHAVINEIVGTSKHTVVVVLYVSVVTTGCSAASASSSCGLEGTVWEVDAASAAGIVG